MRAPSPSDVASSALPPDLSLQSRLRRHPVIAALYGTAPLPVFLDSAAEVGILAHVELSELQAVMTTLHSAGKFILLNMDTCEGLAHDKAAIDYLAGIGVAGLVSTRVATLLRASRAGMITMQKVFVTDRTTWPRSLKALEQSAPNLVQLMPAPMLPRLGAADREQLPPIVAAGFVCNEKEARAALAAGAIALSTSEQRLWKLPAGALGAP